MNDLIIYGQSSGICPFIFFQKNMLTPKSYEIYHHQQISNFHYA